MKKVITLILLAVVTAFGADKIAWEKDLNTARAKAKQVNKPVMFIISSHQCKYCVKLEKETLSDPVVIAALNRDFVSVVAYEDNGDYIPNELRTGGTPTIWFLDPNGKISLGYIPGAVPEADFMYALGHVMKKWLEHEK